jgi:hypothetical protein
LYFFPAADLPQQVSAVSEPHCMLQHSVLVRSKLHHQQLSAPCCSGCTLAPLLLQQHAQKQQQLVSSNFAAV